GSTHESTQHHHSDPGYFRHRENPAIRRRGTTKGPVDRAGGHSAAAWSDSLGPAGTGLSGEKITRPGSAPQPQIQQQLVVTAEKPEHHAGQRHHLELHVLPPSP